MRVASVDRRTAPPPHHRSAMRIALRLVLVAASCSFFPPAAIAQDGGNSSARIRPDPSPLAAEAGTRIEWRASVDDALAEATESGRPVFWYVPTIAGSFMDRQVEVDRYMMAGPFSWPRTIELLNEHFVPVRVASTKELNERFGLERVEFIEPGYLVLAPDGEERARLDRITTFHPRWFLTPLERIAGRQPSSANWPGRLSPDRLRAVGPGEVLLEAQRTGERPEAVELAFSLGAAQPEALYMLGVLAYRAGNDAWGETIWRRLMADHADSPLAAKVAMELEGHGPFLRGFEIYGALPDGALELGEGSQAAAPLDESLLWSRGVDFLFGLQTDDGGFEDSYYDFGGTDGLPNVHVAVTAVAGVALEAARGDDERAARAFELAQRYLLDESNVNPADTDEQIWAHLYRLRFLAACMDGDAEAKAWALAPAQRIADTLYAMQGEGGPWYHEYPNPFVTASCLVALADVKQHGVTVDADIVERACTALERCRTQDGAWTYGMARREARAAIEASVARGPLCELALVLWGRSSQERLLDAVVASFEHEDPLLRIRKYDDHTRFHGYGGFFFWYGLRGRVEAIANLDDDSARQRFGERARKQILALPEYDGCFVDSHEIGRAYGTGMALWCLRVLDGME